MTRDPFAIAPVGTLRGDDAPGLTYRAGAHGAVRYLGRSAIAGDALRCDDCGAHWYPDGERMPATCNPTPDTLRRRADADRAARIAQSPGAALARNDALWPDPNDDPED